MSLEQAIATQTAAILANTEAVNALLSALANGTAPIGATTQPVDVPKTARKKAAEVPVKVEMTTTEGTKLDASPSIFEKTEEVTTPAEETTPPVTREMLTRAVLDLVKVSRQAALDVLKKHGGEMNGQVNAKFLKDENLAAAYADLQAALKAGA